MQMYAIFGTLKGEEEPLLLDCWDDVSVEMNAEGFEEKIKHFQGRQEYGAVRVVILNVPFKAIQAAFRAPVVEATVKE